MTQQSDRLKGGEKLRSLREKRRLLQFDFDLDGIITQANYSKIERGLSKPSKEKLEAILDAMQASFNERRDILESYGYRVPYPLPELSETGAICAECQPILDALPIPAYLVDIITRLVTWNALFEQLAGGRDALMPLVGQPLFKAQFASHLRLREFMEGMDEVLLESVRMIYERLAPYQDERWYSEFLAELCEQPEFQHYWEAAAALGPQESSPVAFAARILHPVQFALPDGDGAKVQFYSNPELLQNDSRFQMIYLIPENGLSLRQVERWRSA